MVNTFQEDKGSNKNYSWRKDMEKYEDNLEKITEHKRNVRNTTQATRDVGFKDTNAKASFNNIDIVVNLISVGL